MKCKICDIELTDENWYPDDRKGGYKICKDCRKGKRNKGGKLFIRDAF